MIAGARSADRPVVDDITMEIRRGEMKRRAGRVKVSGSTGAAARRTNHVDGYVSYDE